MSRSFTLVATDDTTCPGVEYGQLSRYGGYAVVGYIATIPAARNWIRTELDGKPNDLVYLLGDDDQIPDHLVARSLTFPVDDPVYRNFEQVKAKARP